MYMNKEKINGGAQVGIATVHLTLHEQWSGVVGSYHLREALLHSMQCHLIFAIYNYDLLRMVLLSAKYLERLKFQFGRKQGGAKLFCLIEGKFSDIL